MMMTLALLSFGVLLNDFDVIRQETLGLKKEVQEEHVENIARYYDNALAPLKDKEKAEKDAALKELEQFLKEHPGSPQKGMILLSLADLYFDFDLSKSIYYSEEFLKTTPNGERTDAVYYLLGVSYLYEGETEQAEKTFQKFLERYPLSTYADEVRFRLAEIHFDYKEYGLASTYFAQILEHPQSSFYVKALYKLGWTYYLQNNYSDAILQFAKLLDLDSGSSDILKQEASRYLAISLFESSKTPLQATRDYFARFEVSKEWERSVWIYLGNMLVKADKNSEGAQALQAGIALDPKNPKNQELDLRVLELNPSMEVKKNLITRYLDNPEARDIVKKVLFDLGVEKHAKKLYRESAEDYALYINNFPESDNLDEVLFYYSEGTFDAKLYHYAALGFEQLRDWPWDTEYRQRGAVNAVYAYGEEMKQAYPGYDFSTIEVAGKGKFQGKIPPVMLAYAHAVDALADKFSDVADLPSMLFQSAGIYYTYGDVSEAKKRFEYLISKYPKQEAARVAAHILVGDSLASEQWLQAAEAAKQYRFLSDEFGKIEISAQFKHATKLYLGAKTPDEYRQVADLYLKILKDSPKTDFADKVLFNAAMALDRCQRYDEAENLFQMLYSSFPNSPLAINARQQRATYFEQRLLFEKAASIYLKIPGDRLALLRAAVDFEAAQKFASAASLFERFIKEYPDSPEVSDAYVRAASAYSAAGDSKNKRRVLQDFEKRYKSKVAKADYSSLESAMQSYQALLLNGKSSKEQGKQLVAKTEKLTELQKSYEQIIKNYELSSWTLASIYQIGRLYEDLFSALLKAPCPKDVAKIDESACDEYAGLLEDKAFVVEKKAIDAYQLSIDKSNKVIGGSEWVLKAKSALYRMKPSDYVPAEALIAEPVIGVNYTYAIADGSNAEYELLRNNLKEAEALAMARLELYPFDVNARLQMARIFYARGQFGAAELTLEDSLENDAKSQMTHLWLGHVYKALGENAKAILSYEKVDLPEAFDNLGLLYLEQGDLEKAHLNLKKAADAWPNFALVELHLGNYYLMAKDYAQAKTSYENVLRLDPKLSGAKLNMGLLALAEKQYESARASFESFLGEANPEAELKNRVESYLKLANQKIQLEKQRHENNT